MSMIIYGKVPLIEIDECSDKNIEMVYIDSHIRYIVIEILKNAVRATMEKRIESINPIKILFKKTPNDLIIKISISKSQYTYKTSYFYTSNLRS